MKSPILGGFSVSRSTDASDSDIWNLFPEIIETKDGREPGALYMAPGLDFLHTVGTGPIRGLHVLNDQLYVVSGASVYSVTVTYVVTLYGNISSASTPVSMTDNGLQVALCDGQAAYVISAGAMTAITMPFEYPTTLCVIDGFGLASFAGSNKIAQSNELDLATWDPLNFGIAGSTPSNIVALHAIHGELWVLKQDTTEVWADAGAAGFAFQPLSGVHIQSGCIAAFSPTTAGETLCWLSQNSQGQGIVVEAVGYQAKPISTQALVNQLNGYGTIGEAIGYSYQQSGHVFYVLTFPSDDRTWVYDLTASAMAGYPLWHRRAAFDNGLFHRHWGNAFTRWSGAGSSSSVSSTYCADPVVISTPTVLATAGALANLPATFATAVFSVWLDLSDDGGQHGLIVSNQTDITHGTPNGGLFIEVANDQTATPQVTLKAWDASSAAIVSATYNFTTWPNWINLLGSINTATQQLEVYASTLVSGSLVETALTPVALTWSSTNPIPNTAAKPWKVQPTPASGASLSNQIAQLVNPADGLGTPTAAMIDWPRSKVYLWRKNPAAIRVYDIALTTQNPTISSLLSVAWMFCGDVDPVSGNLIVQADTGVSNGAPIKKYNAATLAFMATFGGSGAFPSYPGSIWSGQQLICVGVGTLASGGSVQVGYALIKEAEFSGGVAVVRTDNMTQAGFYAAVVGGSTNNRGIMCRGASGSAGASVFLTWDGSANGQSATIPLYTVVIAPGAETYDPATWPATNSHISSATIGTIPAASVDATWTTLAANSIGYDAIDGNVIIDVTTTNAVAHTHYVIKVNATTAVVMWAAVIAAATQEILPGYRVASNNLVALTTATADLINAATGAITPTTIGGLRDTSGFVSVPVSGGDDSSGLMVVDTKFTQGANSPTPVSGTPSSFTSWAIVGGYYPPSIASAAVADLWFGNTASFVDFTASGNRRLFVSATGATVNLGPSGALPFGTAPPVFLTRVAPAVPDAFAGNAGTGGTFTITGGDLTDASSAPPCNTVSSTTFAPPSSGVGVLGDYRNGNLYAFNLDTLTDNGAQRRWLRTWRALQKAKETTTRFASLTMILESGAQVPDGTNPQCVLRWSDDGGATWSDERISAVGPLGATAQNVRFTRLGSTQRFGRSDRIFELSSTDEFKIAIIGADVEAS